jgi:hypothetical protein
VRHTVLVALGGGLGNQLFRLAAALTVASEFPQATVVAGQGSESLEGLRELTGIALQRANSVEETLAGGVSGPRTGLAYLVRTAAAKTVFSQAVINSGGAWQPRPKVRTLRRYNYVQGPCEHPSFYQTSIESILKSIERNSGAILHELAIGSPGVVLHLRRGDFVTLGRNLDVDYYKRSVSQLQQVVSLEESDVAIVGDDYLACVGLASQLQDTFRSLSFSVEARGSLMADFAIMAHADHLIMSNSTLCWWARKYGRFVRDGLTTVFPETEVCGGNPNADASWILV